jgi:tetratricopeptide (TPR) repeat protein
MSNLLTRVGRRCACWTATLVCIGAAGAAAQTVQTPAEQRIAWAQKAIDANPKLVQPHNDLALALSRRARETGDPGYYNRSERELAAVLALDPSNLDAKKLQVWNLLGKHEFGKAREAATVLNRQVPDDVLIYGFVADANAELGNYDEAETAAQWMLDMRAANLAGHTRAAYLRELFGDVDGALELLTGAFKRMAATEVEDRAWILSQMGHLYLSIGKEANAEAVLKQALMEFPKYHYALNNLAKVRIAQKRFPEAVDLLRDLCAALPHAENVYALAEALELAGSPDAQTTYAEFEKKALAESASADNANRELIAYYADHAKKPREALRIAEIERARRHDVYTRNAYAWALHLNGRHREAREELNAALAVGIQNAEMLFHAGAVALSLNDAAAARDHFERSLSVTPRSPVADAVRRELGKIRPDVRP